ncbi:hypothetical protein ACOMHN_051027 [Nucella lapillus]
MEVVACEIQSKVYQLSGSRVISSYGHVFPVRSALACLTQCSQRSSPRPCAYSGPTGQCFWDVKTGGTHNATDQEVRVYAVRGRAGCEQSVAVDGDTSRVDWGPSGRQGKVRCLDTDRYIYSSDNTTIVCGDSGQWEVHGQCRQRVWNNPPKSKTVFPCPRPVQINWSMCVRGVMCTANCRLSFDLASPEGVVALHLGIYLGSYQAAGMAHRLSGPSWQGVVNVSPFPYTRGQNFAVHVRVLTANKVQVTMNHTTVQTYTSPVSLLTVTSFTLDLQPTDAALHFVDLWAKDTCN